MAKRKTATKAQTKTQTKTKASRTLKTKTPAKDMPLPSDPVALFQSVVAQLKSLPLPKRYKLAFVLEKQIKAEREEAKHALIEKLEKEGMETEKGYFMQEENFIIKLTISHPQRFDSRTFKLKHPDLYNQFLKSYEKRDLFVEEIKKA